MSEPIRYTTALLDANIGSTNVTGKEKINQIVFNTFETITDVLKYHCGPFSDFAITHNVGDTVTEPTFTNDGINIVKALGFLNPIQDFARRNIAYIGSRVENKIGDGTTTAMILASSFMKYMSDPSNGHLRDILSQVSYTELVEQYNLFMQEINERLKLHFILPGNNPDMVGKVAYCQAYTSSHGDVELSSAVAGLFSVLPPAAWAYIYYYREPTETEKRYSVRVEADQFTSKVTIMNKNMFNSKLGTEFFRKKVDVFVYTDTLTAGNEITWKPLEDAIKQSVMEEKPLVILCPDNVDGFTRRAISDLLADDTNHVVSLFMHHPEHPVLNDFRILALFTKQFDLQTPHFLIKDAWVACKGHELTINNIYDVVEHTEHDEYDDTVHPFMFDEDYTLFKQQIGEIKTLIDQAKEDATYRDTLREIAHYVSIYNRLFFRKKYMIVVGGLAYDNTAAMDVLMDTVNAVNNSLTVGYTAGANTAFCDILLELRDDLYNTLHGQDRSSQLKFYLCCAYLAALKDLYDGIEHNVHGFIRGVNPLGIMDHLEALTDEYLNYDTKDGWSLKHMNETISKSEIGSHICSVMQPADLVPEIIKRIGEVCLKFLKTSNIVTINGAYTPPKKKSWWKRLIGLK